MFAIVCESLEAMAMEGECGGQRFQVGRGAPPGRPQCSRRRQQKGEAALKKDEDEDTAQGEAENAGRSEEGRQIAAAPRLKLGVSLAAGQVFGGGALQRSLLTHACRFLVD